MPINYKDYPDNWKSEIRPRILARDGNKCKFCGAPNYELIYRPEKGKADWKLAPEGMLADAMYQDGVRFTKVILTIAHLNHDHNESNDENLAALCQRCHLNLDRNQHSNNRKYGRNFKKAQIKIF